MHNPLKRSDDPERRSRFWTRVSVVIVVAAVFFGVCGFGAFYWQLRQNNKVTNKSIASSNVHHAQTSVQNKTIIEQNKTIIRLTMQIASLQQQHSSDVTSTAQLVQDISTEQQQLAAAEAKLSTAGTYIGQWDAWAAGIIAPLCALSPTTSCPPPPAAPASLGAP